MNVPPVSKPPLNQDPKFNVNTGLGVCPHCGSTNLKMLRFDGVQSYLNRVKHLVSLGAIAEPKILVCNYCNNEMKLN